MTQYDFTTAPNRLGRHTVKWQQAEKVDGLLPLWVADMDFVPMPAIQEALQDYVANHVYGYPVASDSLFQSIIDWEKDQHGYTVTKDQIVLIEGVVPAISVAIQALTKAGDAVLITTPVYPPFARTVTLNDRQLVNHSLIERNGRFELDMEQLEADIVAHQVKLFILCNPHNPGGRVWKKTELQAIGDLCLKHGVYLVSDEIHQDFALFGHQHVTINTVDDRFKDITIVLSSATKTFNIAGTKNSFVIIENEEIRKAFTKTQLTNNQHEVPTIGLIATEAALTYGKPWLEELKAVLETNIDYVVDTLTRGTKIHVMKPEGTYLIWLDFSAYDLSHQEIHEKLLQEAKVQLNDGITFGKEGKKRARLNTAAPFSIIQEACARIVKVFGTVE